MDYRHRALDLDAWTDLVSNVTSLTPVSDDDPRSWLGWGMAGRERLSVFLHEATHHWCFTSPVAFAIAGLTLRARLRIVRALEGQGDLKHSIVVDMVRAETAMALLRPLAEGLALFTEFDAMSRLESRAVSPVLQALFQYFVDPQDAAQLYQSLPAEAAMTASVAKILYSLRIDGATLNRKASCLLKPFRVNAGGYLPGYLTVKSLWRAACMREFRLANETDLFLMYLRSFVYDDWGLVAALLMHSDDAIRSAEHVVNHFNRRLERWDHISSDDIAQYEDYLVLDHRASSTQIPGILVDAADAARGRQLLDVLVDELMTSIEDDSAVATAIATWNASLLNRRHFMNLVSVPVQLTATDGGTPEIMWRGAPLFTPAATDVVAGADLTSGDARLEVVFTHRRDQFERAAVVHRNEQVLVCSPFGLQRHAAETRSNVLAAFRERPKLMAAEKSMRAVMDQVVRESWFQVSMGHCRSQLGRILDEFYRDTALRFARDYTAVDQCAEAMVDRGLRAILNTGRLVRGLALLGLATSLNPSVDFVERVFGEARLDLTDTLDELEAAYERHGYPPKILRGGNSLFSTI